MPVPAPASPKLNRVAMVTAVMGSLLSLRLVCLYSNVNICFLGVVEDAGYHSH